MNELLMIETSNGGERIASGKKQRSLSGCDARNSKGFLLILRFWVVESKDFRTDHKTVIRADGTNMPQQTIVHRLSGDIAKGIRMLRLAEAGRRLNRYLLS